MTSKQVGENIRRIRMDKGMTCRQLAAKVYLSAGCVQNHETTGRGLRLESIQSYADALGVPVSELLGLAQPPKAEEAAEPIVRIQPPKTIAQAAACTALLCRRQGRNCPRCPLFNRYNSECNLSVYSPQNWDCITAVSKEMEAVQCSE